jgi:hypothetical protein
MRSVWFLSPEAERHGHGERHTAGHDSGFERILQPRQQRRSLQRVTEPVRPSLNSHRRIENATSSVVFGRPFLVRVDGIPQIESVQDPKECASTANFRQGPRFGTYRRLCGGSKFALRHRCRLLFDLGFRDLLQFLSI